MPVVHGSTQRSVHLWIGGSSLSLLGDQIYSVASAWAGSELAGASGATLVALSVTVPRLVFMAVGGPIADRWGPRAVLLRSDVARGLLMCAGAIWALSASSIHLLVIVGLALGAVSGIATGASGAMLPRLVEHDRLARLNSVYMVSARLATILGSTAAGVLIAGPGLAAVMLINALTFGVSWALVRRIRVAPTVPVTSAHRSTWADAFNGYRYVFANRTLRWLILSGLAMELGFSWAFNAGIAPLVLERGWGAASLSATLATFAICGLVATLIGAHWEDRAIWTRIVLGEAAIGLGLIAMAGADDRHVPWYVGASVVGCGSGLVGPMLITLVQQRADPQRIGVVMAAASMASLGSVSVSIATFGSLASLSSAEVAWWASGATVLLAPPAALAARRTVMNG